MGGYGEAAVLGVSLFDATLLGWLGLTVLLNAERRRAGLLLTGGALLCGGAFFLAQAGIAGRGGLRVAMYAQWPLGWLIGASLPCAWYLSMLWYSGAWDTLRNPLRARHVPWLCATLVGLAGVLGLIARGWQYPWHADLSSQPFGGPAVLGLPILIAAYPAFIFLCILLSVDVLLRPDRSAPPTRAAARSRARPWLLASSLGLLVVCVLVGAVMVAVGTQALPGLAPAGEGVPSREVVLADLVISSVIAGSVLLLGQAVVSYEIFTGKALPRGGLRRHWHGARALAAGFAAVTAWSVSLRASPFHGLLLLVALGTVAYAVLNWRSYVERDNTIRHLRPFVTSQHVYESLLQPLPDAPDVGSHFAVVAAEVLDAAVAYLVPLGPLSSIAGPPVAYPQGAAVPRNLNDTISRCKSPDCMNLPVEPATHGGAVWAIPLWSERGLVGLLLLGPKRGRGLYTQEEVEIARATGERLIDTVACARMAQQLMALQRRRLAESQLMDRRTRRVLHDEALPRLHAAMLALSATPGADPAELRELAAVHHQVADLLRDMPAASTVNLATEGLMATLQRTVEDELAGAFDETTWEVDPVAQERAAKLGSLALETLHYAAREAIRNAARHGRGDQPDRPLRLSVSLAWQGGLELTVQDTGVGLPVGPAPASPRPGGGQGVRLHSTMMAVIGGTWTSESEPGVFTRVILSLPEYP